MPTHSNTASRQKDGSFRARLRHCLLLACSLLLVIGSSGQKNDQAYVDSLIAELPRVKKDTAHVRLLGEIAFKYAPLNSTKGLHYAEKALQLATELNDLPGMALAHKVAGNNHMARDDYPGAMTSNMTALALYESLKDERGMGMMYVNIGLIFHYTGSYEKAVEYQFKALDIAKKLGRKGMEFRALSHIGLGYRALGLGEPAIRYTRSALEMAEAMESSEGVVLGLNNLGFIHTDLGNYHQALEYHQQALDLVDTYELSARRGTCLGGSGIAYLEMARSSFTHGDEVKGREELGKAIDLLHQSLALRSPDDRMDRHTLYKRLSQAYALGGRFEQAFKYQRDHLLLRDSLFSVESATALAHAQTDLTLALKDRDLTIAKLELKQHIRERSIMYVAIVLMLLVLVVLFRSRTLLGREKQRSEALLLNVLPDKIARELKTTGTTQPSHHDNVTILFTDFKDYTKVVGSLTARQTVQLIDHYFSRFDEIVKSHGLEKIKTIGDAYMCVSGIPDENPDHALRATRAAKDILAFVKEEEAKRTASGEPWFQIRIGLHTGPVVAGVVGRTKFAYDVWGDTVNVASRLEQHGEAGRINISRTTFEYVKHRFPCVPKGYITVKHGVELELYQVEEVGELVV